MSKRNIRLSASLALFVVCAGATLAINRYSHQTSLTAIVAAKPAASAEYAMNANGVMFGSEPSPLQFVSASREGASLPVNGTFTGTDDLLAGATLTVKNNANSQINYARLSIDLINSSTGRVVGNVCSPLISNLDSGAERSHPITTASAEAIRQAIAKAGGNRTRVLVRVDLVQFTDTGWKYGLLHRPDSGTPGRWIPVTSGARIGQVKQQFRLQPASFKAALGPSGCGYFAGYDNNNSLRYCESCACSYYDAEVWVFNSNGGQFPGPYSFGDIDIGCGGYYPGDCPGCTKTGYISGSC
jgi:hypothetical protein